MMSKHIEREHTEFGRRTINRHGWIVIDGHRHERCTLTNVSDTGGTLICEHPQELPFLFEVVDERDGWHERCQIGEVTDAGVGVSFIETGEDITVEPEPDQLVDWTGSASGPAHLPDHDRAAWLEAHRPRRSPWAELAYSARRWLAGEVHLSDLGIGQHR